MTGAEQGLERVLDGTVRTAALITARPTTFDAAPTKRSSPTSIVTAAATTSSSRLGQAGDRIAPGRRRGRSHLTDPLRAEPLGFVA